MKHFLLLITLLTFTCNLFAQPKIAVYTPATNTTRICPTLDSAYTVSQNGDYIYLPAGTFSFSNTSSNIFINKRIIIYGAGINPDSSLMGITSISSNINILAGADSSYFEGVRFNSYISFGTGPGNIGDTTAKVTNIRFQRCDFIGNITLNNPLGQMLQTNKPKNISFYESKMGNLNAPHLAQVCIAPIWRKFVFICSTWRKFVLAPPSGPIWRKFVFGASVPNTITKPKRKLCGIT